MCPQPWRPFLWPQIQFSQPAGPTERVQFSHCRVDRSTESKEATDFAGERVLSGGEVSNPFI